MFAAASNPFLTGLPYTMAAAMVGFGINVNGKYGLNARQELDPEITR
jgi:hypothetical protein